MNAIQSTKNNSIPVLWIAVGLAIFTALAHVLIAFNILGVGDLQMDEKSAAIIYIAAGCYLLGGLLILIRNRWFGSRSIHQCYGHPVLLETISGPTGSNVFTWRTGFESHPNST